MITDKGESLNTSLYHWYDCRWFRRLSDLVNENNLKLEGLEHRTARRNSSTAYYLRLLQDPHLRLELFNTLPLLSLRVDEVVGRVLAFGLFYVRTPLPQNRLKRDAIKVGADFFSLAHANHLHTPLKETSRNIIDGDVAVGRSHEWPQPKLPTT
jgi:hypothetical protein